MLGLVLSEQWQCDATMNRLLEGVFSVQNMLWSCITHRYFKSNYSLSEVSVETWLVRQLIVADSV
jgi:hypothetical protein